MEAKIIGINRHRIGVDGQGVTTLVAFHGCPLRCKYCLNPQGLDENAQWTAYTPESLYQELASDDLYFRASGGGVCFGGGEPLLQAEFIKRFRELCGDKWRITVETCLNVRYTAVEMLAPIVDEWIVDIKTNNPQVYEQYTGKHWGQVEQNLHFMTGACGVAKDNVLIRIPIIPGFVTREEAEATKREFEEMGFTRFDIFEYQTERPRIIRSLIPGYEPGKARCEVLRTIRENIAEENDIELPRHNCQHQGDCPGTCPMCEQELSMLRQSLGERNIEVSEKTSRLIDALGEPTYSSDETSDTQPEQGYIVRDDDNDIPPLEGEVSLPPEKPSRKRVLFKECAVAGVSFHLNYDDELWFELEEGQRIALVRDRKNKYDKNAVAVALFDDYDGDPDDFDFDCILGYVPRSENAEIAQMLDMGWEDVFYVTLSTVKTHGNINNRLRISIYIQSKEPESPKILRIESLGFNECKEMITELQQRGTVHFRWRCCPMDVFDPPATGDKVVLLRRQAEKVVMFLMRVIARGDDCFGYVDDPDEIHAVDDCDCFVLTNIAGPVTVDLEALKFLGIDTLGKRDVHEPLDEENSNALEAIFTEQLHGWLPSEDIPLPEPPEDKNLAQVIEYLGKPSVQFFYRDTSAQYYGAYKVGDVVRTDCTLDMSEKFFKPIRKTRFLIATGHATSHCDIYKSPKPSDKAVEWRLATLPRNSYFQVLDIYYREDVDQKQILLLHIPAEALNYLDNEKYVEAVRTLHSPYPYVGDLIAAAREDFDHKLSSTVFPRQTDKELVERMKRPVGYIRKGQMVSLELPVDEMQLLRDFIAEKLDGDIERLVDFDFSSITESKYQDIVKAIFAVAFADNWPDLNLESLKAGNYALGDIILTQRLFGAHINNEYFMGLDKYKHVVTPDLMKEAFEVEHWCGTIGNIIVWPNKGRLYNLFDDWKMRGYFDRMLQAMHSVMTDAPRQNDDVKAALHQNAQLMRDYQGKEGFDKFIKASLLSDFVEDDGTPKEVFAGVSIAAKDFWPTQLPLAIHEMYTFCKHFIPTRTQEIINILKFKL